MSESQGKLADVPVSVSSTEDQREPPKALKKKAPPQRPQARENHVDGSRASLDRHYKPFHERTQSYHRERERIFEGVPDGQHPEAARSAISLRNGSDGGNSSDFGKATFRNRNQELLDPEFQRFRYAPGYGGGVEGRFRPMHGEGVDQMAQMMQGLSFGHGPDHAGLAYGTQHPNAVQIGSPYGPMAIPAMGYNYQGHMMQQMPQGVGMYNTAGVPYAYPQVPHQQYAHAAYSQQYVQPYPPYAMPLRPTNGIMAPYGAQQMGQNIMPYYQHPFVQQGYQMPGPAGQGGRPGFPAPPRQQQTYQPRPIPSNGSGGYSRVKPNLPANRPTKSEASVTPKSVPETSAAAVSAPAPSAHLAGGSSSPKASTIPAEQTKSTSKDSDNDQA